MTMNFPEDVAALLSAKIAEFEKTSAVDAEKNQKAAKGKVRVISKTKIKETKQLINNADIPEAQKVTILWEKLQSEHEQIKVHTEEALKLRNEIGDTERERDEGQAELNRVLAVKGKLESVCKQLQSQTKGLVEERRQLTDSERLKRQELADEFQNTIGDVKKKMDQQANERAQLARENEELRSKFKLFFEQYDKREKELLEQQKEHEAEVQTFAPKLTEQAQLYRKEALREQTAQRENDELVNTEKALREQLQTYSSKFNHFQDALSKSDKVLGQHKRQRNKMQRRVEILEKENLELRNRNDRRMGTVTKERDALHREKEEQQEKCKALQAERGRLVEDLQKYQGTVA